MRSILERLRKLEAVAPQIVRVLVTMDEKKVEMSVKEFLQLPEIKCFGERLDCRASPYEPCHLPLFRVITPKYERLTPENISDIITIQDATMHEKLRHSVPDRDISDYE